LFTGQLVSSNKMASVNKVILVGNCGRDPEVRYLPSGQAVANVSIATSSRRRDKNTGESMEDTQWHRVTFYDRLAEIAGEYVKKGRPIYVEGRLKYGKYTDPSGVEKNTVDIIATELQLLGGREGMGGAAGFDESAPAARRAAPAASPRPAAPIHRPVPTPAPASAFTMIDDDDLPF
jgi:single-strand DNA-binding protein